MDIIETKVIRTETSKSIELGEPELRRLLEAQGVVIPADATITVQVPGGGDYSNMSLDIDDRTPVVVAWTEVTET
jgi:hypothetical protein